jgi:hypothetical protein
MSNSGSTSVIAGDNWTTKPTASSSKIKVFTEQPQAVLNGALMRGLPQMGFNVVQKTEMSIETNSFRAESESIKVRVWIDGNSLVLTSEIEVFEQSDFDLPTSNGFIPCNKGNMEFGSECWRTISSIADQIAGNKLYQ